MVCSLNKIQDTWNNIQIVIMERISKQIYNEIMKAKNILIVPHQNPDGDALGSVSSLAHYFNRINKPYTVFCVTPMPINLTIYPHLIHPSSAEAIWQDKSFDVIIVMDSGDLKYAGIDKHVAKLEHEPIIINIDHHATNQKFGHYNLVMPSASSASEIIYYFIKKNNIEIDKKMASAIMLGLITDTENFTNPGTTVSSFTVASDLIKKGANFNLLKSLFLKNKTIPALKLWGTVLSRLEKNQVLDIVYTYITQEDLILNQASETEIEGITNFLNNLNEGRGALILKQLEPGKIKGSFRTTRDDFDVSAIAKILGGGGHRKAAGFTIPGTIEEALNKIWEEIKRTA